MLLQAPTEVLRPREQSGRITGELPGDGTTEEEVMGLAMADNLSALVEAAAAGAEDGGQ